MIIATLPDLLRNMLEELKVWISSDEFGDLIAEIPYPTEMQLRFLDILSELRISCADREALLFMIKIDKLKTREKLPQS